MNPKINAQVAGRYKVRAINPANNQVKRESEWFDNIITDIGMNQIADTASWSYAHVGTGSAPALQTNSSLESLVASDQINGAPVTGNSGASPYYAFSISKYTFALGAVVGNMSEVGVSHDNTPNSLSSRALIVDGGGSPTTFTVNADEIFEMLYEYRFYPPETDEVLMVLDAESGITHTVTIRTGDIDTWSFDAVSLGANQAAFFRESDALVPITDSFPVNNTATYSRLTYAPDSHQRVYRIIASENQHEYPTGIGGAGFRAGQNNGFATNAVQVSFSPKILKTVDDVLQVDCVVSWARRP